MRRRVPLLRRNDRVERSTPRPPREKPDCGRWARQEGPECRTDADSGFQPSVPRLSVVPVCYGGTSCKACHWEAGHRQLRALRATDPLRVRAGVGDGSAQGGRRDCRKHGDAATAAAGNGVVCARSRPVSAGARNSRKAAASPCRRPAYFEPRALARGRCPSASTAFATAADWLSRFFAACLPAGPRLRERILTRAACCHFIAGDGRRCPAWK